MAKKEQYKARESRLSKLKETKIKQRNCKHISDFIATKGHNNSQSSSYCSLQRNTASKCSDYTLSYRQLKYICTPDEQSKTKRLIFSYRQLSSVPFRKGKLLFLSTKYNVFDHFSPCVGVTGLVVDNCRNCVVSGQGFEHPVVLCFQHAQSTLVPKVSLISTTNTPTCRALAADTISYNQLSRALSKSLSGHIQGRSIVTTHYLNTQWAMFILSD